MEHSEIVRYYSWVRKRAAQTERGPWPQGRDMQAASLFMPSSRPQSERDTQAPQTVLLKAHSRRAGAP